MSELRVISARFDAETHARIALAAARLGAKLGRKISVSDVVRGVVEGNLARFEWDVAAVKGK